MLASFILVEGGITIFGIQGCLTTLSGRWFVSSSPTFGCGLMSMVLMVSGLTESHPCSTTPEDWARGSQVSLSLILMVLLDLFPIMPDNSNLLHTCVS